MNTDSIKVSFKIALFGMLLTSLVRAQASRNFPEPATDDMKDFVAIFDGRTLADWDADPKYWHVEDGALVGVVTPETLLKSNSFAIWRGGLPADFELKVEYRISAGGNSGINYRSTQLPTPAFGPKGYQVDIDASDRFTGQNYEERGRAFLAMRGQVTRATPDRKPVVIGAVEDKDTLSSFIGAGDWNQVHLIARGNVLIHMVNGHVTSIVVDEDPARRTTEGRIGVQVHVGPPMKVEFRNFLLKPLTP